MPVQCRLELQLAAHALMLAMVSADWAGFQDEDVTLKLCSRHVEKSFLMPQEHVETLCNVYRILASSAIPHAARCTQLKVGSHALTLPSCFTLHAEAVHFPESQLLCQRYEHASLQVDGQVVDLQTQHLRLPGHHQPSHIELHLSPVGVRFQIQTSDQLRSLTTSLLTTAAAIHLAGIVHCDIRAANVVQYRGEWVLIDWELAGPIGTPVWWRAKDPPPATQSQGGWPIAADLWQIGRLIQGYAPLDPPCQSFAQDLMNGAFLYAEAASAAVTMLAAA